MVRLVDEDGCGRGKLADESFQIFTRRKAGRRVVGIANVDEAGGGVGLREGGG